jgi:hypothetical protein
MSSADTVANRGSAGLALGTGRHTWLVSPEHVDLAPPEAAPCKVTIQADPQNITVDLTRTAIIVVDMQNDFCAPGGWVDNLGADLTPRTGPDRAATGADAGAAQGRRADYLAQLG